MKYTVEQDREVVEIQVEGVGDKAPALMTSFQECQSGDCSCPTDQYERLADLEVSRSGDTLRLRLTAFDGQRFDVGDLETCLDHTISKAEEA